MEMVKSGNYIGRCDICGGLKYHLAYGSLGTVCVPFYQTPGLLFHESKEGQGIMISPYNKDTVTFEQWYIILESLFVRLCGHSAEQIREMNPSDWECYYNDGYSPEEAIREDFSYG